MGELTKLAVLEALHGLSVDSVIEVHPDSMLPDGETRTHMLLLIAPKVRPQDDPERLVGPDAVVLSGVMEVLRTRLPWAVLSPIGLTGLVALRVKPGD